MVFSFGVNALFNSNQGTSIEINKCIVLGPIKAAFNYTLPPKAEILVVNFKADSFYRFFGKASMSDQLRFNPDDAVAGNCFTALWHELNAIETVSEKVSCLLDYCRPFLRSQDANASLFSNFESDSKSIIKSIAGKTGQSERNVQLIHKKYFGYSAQERNKYLRFLKAIEFIQVTLLSNMKVNWFEVIDKCDYYDQSQLIHDFKYFINLSPKNYLKFQQHICQVITE